MAWSLVFEIVSPVAAMTLYVTLYASSSWVVAADAYWGLWTWCSTTSNGTTNCSTISYDDTEGYFEAVRILSSFALIVYISSAYAVLSKGCRNDQRKRNTFPMLAVAAGVLSVTVIGVLVENYKKDKAFQKHRAVGLGWCVWLHVVSAALTLLGACLRCYNDKKWSEGISASRCKSLRSRWDAMRRRAVSENSVTTRSAGAKPPSQTSVWYLRPRSGAGLSATCQTDAEYLFGLPGYDAASPQHVMPQSALPLYVSPTSPPPPYEIAVVSSSLPPPPYACAARSSSLSNCHDDVESNVGVDSTVLLPRSERHDSVQAGVVICVMSRSSTAL